MKKQMKIMMSMVITAIILFMAIPLSYAAEETNFSVILTASPTAVKQGETLDVTISLDSFTNIGEGINSFMGDLEYDKTKLSIESSKIVAQNGWDTPTYENDKLLTLKGSMVTEKEAIIKMTFTVNSDAELGTTTISVKNAEAANTENDFVGEDGAINIEIQEAIQQPEAGTPEESSPKGEQQKQDNTVKKADIPKAGISYIEKSVLIIALIIIGIVLYRKYNYYQM